MLEREAPTPLSPGVDLPPPPTNRRGGTAALLTAAAALLYGWGLTRGAPHFFYSAAVRSMGESWTNFVFGAVDPGGTITLDKIPGWLWPHVALVKVFGLHDWVLLLPEMLAATGTVPLLYAAVRRWAGDRAALLAAVGYLVTPITFRAAQLNLPDTLLVFCLVAAAWALIRAWRRPGWTALLGPAVLLGLAFQMKMLQALLVLPAFALAYLVGSAGPMAARLGRTAVFGTVTLAVSALWMVVVSLTPPGSRPAIDGSPTGSVWEMVLAHNGTEHDDRAAGTFGGAPGPIRLLNEQVGTQVSWLLPLALAALVVGVAGARRDHDRDRLAGWVLWGGWLLVAGSAFSQVYGMHPYYTAMLVPAIGAVLGGGLGTALAAWRAGRPLGWLLPAGVLGTAGWAVVLLLREPVGLDWLAVVVAVAGVAATALLLVARRGHGSRAAEPPDVTGARPGPTAERPDPTAARRAPAVAAGAALVAGVVAVLAGPAGWLLSTPVLEPGSPQIIDPVAGPAAFQRIRQEALNGGSAPRVNPALLDYLTRHDGDEATPRDGGEHYLFAAGESGTAAPYIRAGYTVLPLRGFALRSPRVPVARIERLVADGRLRYLLLIDRAGPMVDPATAGWLRSHCAVVPRTDYEPDARPGPWDPTLYDCRR
ncbi:glycosyltransferase family 39 protein [Plantactinospora sp. KBS50]|uniref:glycosyltransferase family 39 protein n=1 Tax=Plantactinospora sp. KBS50 TaxID=2024580 RepID=UPI000BAAB648|nr:glycosyltransferase family 39 protein [Plantactinospora sp. KBS50]ASW56949.1 hypothetical protein CIK06_26525 [Plantactinospora sp. KBS50]